MKAKCQCGISVEIPKRAKAAKEMENHARNMNEDGHDDYEIIE